MDAEEIQKRLMNLGQRPFKRVVSLVLRKVLGYDAINVDASGDGGSDWLLFQNGGQKLHLAIQDTIQTGVGACSVRASQRHSLENKRGFLPVTNLTNWDIGTGLARSQAALTAQGYVLRR